MVETSTAIAFARQSSTLLVLCSFRRSFLNAEPQGSEGSPPKGRSIVPRPKSSDSHGESPVRSDYPCNNRSSLHLMESCIILTSIEEELEVELIKSQVIQGFQGT